jgi:hypothetical protein
MAWNLNSELAFLVVEWESPATACNDDEQVRHEAALLARVERIGSSTAA